MIDYQYDDDGLLTQAADLSLQRDSDNGLLSGTDIGRLSDQWLYNLFGETKSYTVAFDNKEIYKVTYPERDKLGRIINKQETINNIINEYIYDYDLAGRLDTVKKNGILISDYDYDDNGNRKQYTNSNGTITGQYDDQDRLSQYANFKYEYTANGELKLKTNLSTNATTQYVYDVFGNLGKVTLADNTKIEYIIDARNRRIGKKINDQLVQGFLYQDSLNPIAELDGNGDIVSTFIYGDRGNIPSYMVKAGKNYRIIADHLGSPVLVVDIETGEVVQEMAYNEYGLVIKDSNPGFQPFGFAGGIYDRNTGLVRFGVRDYDAEIGRWTAKDPIRFEGGDSNLYAYVQNDPVNWIDPWGLIRGQENIPSSDLSKPVYTDAVLPDYVITSPVENQPDYMRLDIPNHDEIPLIVPKDLLKDPENMNKFPKPWELPDRPPIPLDFDTPLPSDKFPNMACP